MGICQKIDGTGEKRFSLDKSGLPNIEKEIQKATYYNLLNNINTLEVMLTEKEEKDGHLLPPSVKLQM